MRGWGTTRVGEQVYCYAGLGMSCGARVVEALWQRVCARSEREDMRREGRCTGVIMQNIRNCGCSSGRSSCRRKPLCTPRVLIPIGSMCSCRVLLPKLQSAPIDKRLPWSPLMHNHPICQRAKFVRPGRRFDKSRHTYEFVTSVGEILLVHGF